jgi:hypothetical protein
MTTTTPPLEQVRDALRNPDHHLRLVRIWLSAGDTWAVQVYVKGRKIGPLLLPPEGGTVLDTLTMLDELTKEVSGV